MRPPSSAPESRPPGRPSPAAVLVLVVAMALGMGCGDGGSTEPASPPASLVQVSMPVDTVVTGEQTDPPLSVRVEDALGNAVEGTPVRFVVVRGGGRMFPGVAVSGLDGIAESSYEAAAEPGAAEIRADIPSAPNVPPVQFTVHAQAADSVLLSVVGGDGQRAEVGSQLPLPFEVRARAPSGAAAGGISIVFRITDGRDQSPLLTADSVLTGTEGRASTVLTLGRAAREYVVTAFAARGVLSDTVRFRATATAEFEGSVLIDSVGSGGLVTASRATLYGRGFSPIAAENEVRIEGESAEVLEATGSALTILVPDFGGRCLPERSVGVRVLVGQDASNGPLITLLPRTPQLDLAVGETATLSGPEAVSCLQLGSSSTPREYRIAIGSAARAPGESFSYRLSARAPAEAGVGRAATSITARELESGVQEAVRERTRPDVALRLSALRELRGARVTPVSLRPRTAALRSEPPAAGDTLSHYFAVRSNLTAACSDTTTRVEAVVRAVGRHLALAEDITAPAGGFSAEQWEALLNDLDGTVVPVDTAYFGGFDDIDGNGRVTVLFTPEVNRLSGTGGPAAIGGFFLPLDLAASGRGGGGLPGAGETCPASNEAEILYMAVPDPEGEVGPTIGVARALRNARGLVAHELEHLINAERRILRGEGGFAAAEEVWLDEALASLAEEVAGLATIQRSVGGNYSFDQVAGTRAALDAFNTFQLNNFFNLSLYMFDPASAATISATDPGGAEGLQMRGFGWFLLRWLGDQAGGDERSFYRALVTGGQNAARGVANVEAATGRSWDDLLADFAVALAADDAGVESLSSRFRVITWEFRDIFAALNRNAAARSLFPLPFPLQASSLGFETGSLIFDVGASTFRYFALVSGLDAPPLAVGLSTPGGVRLSETAAPQITIVRTR